MALGQYHSLMEPKLPQDTESRHADKYIIRFPDGMRDRLKEEARTNNRTLNAEIVARLQASFEVHEAVENMAFEHGFESTGLKNDIERLNAQLEKMQKAKEAAALDTDAVAERVVQKLFSSDAARELFAKWSTVYSGKSDRMSNPYPAIEPPKPKAKTPSSPAKKTVK